MTHDSPTLVVGYCGVRRRLLRHFVPRNYKDEKISLINVISSEARNPYDVALASSISGNEYNPLMSLRAKRSNLLVS